MSDSARILELLEEAVDSGRTPEDVCRGHPELLQAVRERLEACRQIELEMDHLFPSSRGLASGNGTKHPLGSRSEFPSIPGYEIEAVLGHGGMGVVYRARHLRLRRPVALKMLLSGAFASGLERARLVREARAVAGLRHSHIVQVYDVGESDGHPFFTMELIEGGSLAEKLGGLPRPPHEAAEMVATLAGAVEAAHQTGIIHRDLKPANVLLSVDGTPKVSDFGLARRFAGEGESDAGLTVGDGRIGTPSYMAPEQASGRHGAVGPTADVYALGAILYEMLTGRPPFRAESPAETERQLLTEEPVPPSRLDARVSARH